MCLVVVGAERDLTVLFSPGSMRLDNLHNRRCRAAAPCRRADRRHGQNTGRFTGRSGRVFGAPRGATRLPISCANRRSASLPWSRVRRWAVRERTLWVRPGPIRDGHVGAKQVGGQRQRVDARQSPTGGAPLVGSRPLATLRAGLAERTSVSANGEHVLGADHENRSDAVSRCCAVVPRRMRHGRRPTFDHPSGLPAARRPEGIRHPCR